MKVREFLGRLGPSFIATTTTFGPASLLLAGLAGAQYRYEVTWVLLLLLIERYLFLDAGTRVGLSTPQTFFTTIGNLWGKKLAAIGGILSFLSIALYASGNILGTATASQLLFGGNLVVWGIVFIIVDVFLFYFSGIYQRLEKIALTLVVIMLVTFLTTLFITGWSAGEFVRGFIPTPNPGSLLLGLALFLTCSSQQGVANTYMAREKYKREDATHMALFDHISSTLFMLIIVGVIMSVGAEVLNPAGIIPSSAPQFALMLEPLAGSIAKILFAVGLFGAAFTSLTGQPILVSLYLADGFQRCEQGVSSPLVKQIAIGLVIIMGLWGVIPVALGSSMMNIYWIASIATSIAIPLNGFLMLKLVRREDILGNLVFSQPKFIIASLVYVFVVTFSVYNLITSL